jgi:hypothetical protein
MPRLSPKNLVIVVLGAAVIGLGSVVAVDHTVGSSGARTQAASLASTTLPTSHQPNGYDLGNGTGELSQVLKLFTQDTGLTAQQLLQGVGSGKTLDDLAGANAGKLKTDLMTALKTALDKAVGKGAIDSGQETKLLADAGDALDVLLSAKLGALFPAH